MLSSAHVSTSSQTSASLEVLRRLLPEETHDPPVVDLVNSGVQIPQILATILYSLMNNLEPITLLCYGSYYPWKPSRRAPSSGDPTKSGGMDRIEGDDATLLVQTSTIHRPIYSSSQTTAS